MQGNIKIIIILGHFAFLLVYATLVAALLWHYQKYSLPRDRARWIIGLFLTIASILAVISTILIFSVPWEKIANLKV
ncbi:MAG: hypothetical protein HYY55_02955 [Candidatus Niyogibacteria bacterium]|nr:MAG: hypothetical protein HYY55_02955 [Candidatus Niyogibacteria bacterium]